MGCGLFLLRHFAIRQVLKVLLHSHQTTHCTPLVREDVVSLLKMNKNENKAGTNSSEDSEVPFLG
jgi:hypothetical protein